MAKWREVKQGKIPRQKNKILSSDASFPKNTASLAVRLKAFLTDTFLLTTPIFYIVIYVIMGGGEAFSQNRSAGWGLIFLFHFSFIAFFWLRKAQTPGMKAYSIKLVSNPSNSSERTPSFLQITLRYCSTLVAVVSIFLLFIPFFRKDKRTIQDILSHTHIALE